MRVRGSDAARSTPLRVRLGGGPLGPGRYVLRFRVEATAGPARFAIADASAEATDGAPATLDAPIDHPGGSLTLLATGAAPPGGSLWIGDAKIAAVH